MHVQVVDTGVVIPRQPGVAVYYSDSLQGLPPIFEQLLATAPVLHNLIIFLHIRQVCALATPCITNDAM